LTHLLGFRSRLFGLAGALGLYTPDKVNSLAGRTR
jgi:hypothetical protein